jgi:hypothetical protein
MLRKKPEKKPDDDLTLRLRAAVRKKRPWSWKAVLIVLAVILVPVGILIWTLRPRPEPPAVTVTAFDQIALPKEQVTLRARLEPTDSQTGKIDLAGYELFFEKSDLAKTTALGKAATDDGGEASLAWQSPAGAGLVLFAVRYPGDKARRASASQGKIFTLDRGAALLVVDIAALSPATLEKWRSENVLRIGAQAGAGTALKAAHDRKYQIVYLATAADGPRLYAKMRGWVENQWAGTEPFPAGPVLGTMANSAADVLRELKTRFGGPLLVVAGSSQAAKSLRDAGGRLLVIGPDAVEPPAIRLDSWPDLGAHLAK